MEDSENPLKKEIKLREGDISLAHYKAAVEKARKILHSLVSALKNESYYPPHHPFVAQSLSALHEILKSYLLEGKPIILNFFQDELYYEDVPLPEESLSHAQLIKNFSERDIGSITFQTGVTSSELRIFIHLLNKNPEELSEKGGLIQALAHENVEHIIVGKPQPTPSQKIDTNEGSVEENLRKIAKETYHYALGTIQEITENIKSGQPINVKKAKSTVQLMVDHILQDPYAMLGLANLKNYDYYTFYHSVNVLILSLTLGATLPLKRVPLSILGISALLHDVGKIKIPSEIIKKPGPLTSEEWKIVERHPLDGAEILSEVRGLNKLSIIVAFEHHMSFNQRGYPRLPSPRTPHIFSQIVGIADAYDAMTSQRSYRPPELPDNALKIILQLSNESFDPILTKSFVKLMGIYPVGSLVKLNTGEIGVVYRSNPNDLLHPIVKIILDKNGYLIDPYKFDLSQKKDGEFEKTITRSLDPEAFKINVNQYLL